MGHRGAALGGRAERARGIDPGLLHRSVDGEWSFIETLRHLVFATDAWVRRAMLGDAHRAGRGVGWPPPECLLVRECLLTVLNEEWHHRQFAERDLAALEPG